MSRHILIAVTAAALVLSFATAGSAANAPQATALLLSRQSASATPVDYYYNHHHYRHRRWDPHRRHWQYY